MAYFSQSDSMNATCWSKSRIFVGLNIKLHCDYLESNICRVPNQIN